MNTPRQILLSVSLAAAAAAATPAFGQSIPDFSGVWRHPSLPWLEPPASGPGPVTNRVRRKADGASDYGMLVGDYTNPILQPWAAAVVKKFGEISRAGITYANPANQCWPEPVPFIFKHNGIQMLRQPHQITILLVENQEFRRIRMNEPHPAHVTPSWHGDFVGHYEGDTLVVDTVGVRTDRPFAMVDLFGTPYSDKLHVVERYRLVPYDEAKPAMDRDQKENWRFGGDINRNYRGKYLQVHLTIEDPGVFTTPWTATVTYGRGSGAWQETVCSENRGEFYHGDLTEEAAVPTTLKPDF